MDPERCDSCGFDADDWNDQDTANTIALAPTLLGLWATGLDDVADQRPALGVWSVVEYVDHVRETLSGARFVSDLAVAEPGRDLGPTLAPGPAGEHRLLDLAGRLGAVRTEAQALSGVLAAMGDDGWDAHVVLDGRPRTVRSASRHAVHELWHHLTDVAALRTALGRGVPAAAGTVTQVNVSGGGVPKRPVEAADVTRRGVAGDVQKVRRHHGRPWQALCLWSADVIEALAGEGHPIAAGSAGENVTVGGLDWSTLTAGAVLEIGEVRCQLSAPAVPCAKNDRWFAHRDSGRIDHDRHPGWSRWYASVLRPGRIATGDPVALRPPGNHLSQEAPLSRQTG